MEECFMKTYTELSQNKLREVYSDIKKQYENHKKKNYCLDMSRGKPCPEQLDLSNGILQSFDAYVSASGIDCRNYGELSGLAEMKEIFSDLLEVGTDEIIVGGNSSLNMMFDNLAVNMMHGVRDGEPWSSQGKVKFLCPSPGYDRHFAICEYFHITMIPIKMNDDGPDMDIVEKLVASDYMIKGMWCVPKYSNPDGITYSPEVVKRIANLRPAAHDFRLYWDNAYAIHNLYEHDDYLPNILRECEKSGKSNMPYMFTSFSKVSFSGSSISALCSSKSNIEYITTRLAVQTIGSDKLNQIRHVNFFKNADNIRLHMKKHADILRPKFETTLAILNKELANDGVSKWNNPRGGYFVSFYSMEGCAKKIVKYCKEAGITFTTAGATYPYGYDPQDSNIRIAPSYPSLSELEIGMSVFCCAVKLAVLEKLINNFG